MWRFYTQGNKSFYRIRLGWIAVEREFSGVEKRLFLILFLAMIVVISGFAYLFMGDNKPSEKNFVGVININGPILTVEGTEMVVDSINKALQ